MNRNKLNKEHRSITKQLTTEKKEKRIIKLLSRVDEINKLKTKEV